MWLRINKNLHFDPVTAASASAGGRGDGIKVQISINSWSHISRGQLVARWPRPVTIVVLWGWPDSNPYLSSIFFSSSTSSWVPYFLPSTIFPSLQNFCLRNGSLDWGCHHFHRYIYDYCHFFFTVFQHHGRGERRWNCTPYFSITTSFLSLVNLSCVCASVRTIFSRIFLCHPLFWSPGHILRGIGGGFLG